MRRYYELTLVSLLVLGLAACSDEPADPGAADSAPPAADGSPPTSDGGVAPDGAQTPDSSLPPLSWRSCDTSVWPAGYPTPGPAVRCTSIKVPLDHSKPGGKSITLRVARQKSSAFPSGKAVFNLAGGPGGASIYQSGVIPYYMPELLKSFDMIYVDQRGTGGSSRLDCSGGYPESTQQWIACAVEHKDTPLDRYLTVDAAHDLDLVRKRLGYTRIYLRGGSYGTRMGLEYIRQYGDNVVAAVLDGLAPPDWDIFGYNTASLQQAIDKLVKDCNAHSSCKAAVPDLATDLANRRAALKKKPRPISVGGTQTYESEAYFVMFLGALLDRATWRYQIPRAIRQSQAGDNTLWNKLMSTLWGYTVTDAKAMPPGSSAMLPLPPPPPLPSSVHPWPLAGVEYVAPGLLLTVMCAEWFPNSGGIDKLRAKVAQRTWVRASVLDLPSACASVDVSPTSATLRKPVTSKVKTLLLSGEIDIRTPVEMGTHTSKTLVNSKHVVIPHASHSTISNSCAAKILTAFFNSDGDLAKLDTSCLKSVPHPGW